MTTKKTADTGLTEDQLALLNSSYPVADEEARLTLPRLGLLAKDITEETGKGKDKKITVVEAAGTFFTERDLGETNEEGKKVWTREYLGDDIEVVIVYHRRQLRMWDQNLEKFYSTPIFDSAEQQIPLYLDGKVMKRGTQAELQAMFPKLTQKGKPSSDLKEDCILYAVYNGELFQVNLSQSSKWMFKTYSRSVNPATVVTRIGSVEDEFGSNVFRKMTFTKARPITADEFDAVLEGQQSVKSEADRSAQVLLASGEQAQDEDDGEF